MDSTNVLGMTQLPNVKIMNADYLIFEGDHHVLSENVDIDGVRNSLKKDQSRFLHERVA